MKTVYANTRERMDKTIASLKYEYNSIRAGRANAAVLDKITVDYYGCPTPINQMAAISVPEARRQSYPSLLPSAYGRTQKTAFKRGCKIRRRS